MLQLYAPNLVRDCVSGVFFQPLNKCEKNITYNNYPYAAMYTGLTILSKTIYFFQCLPAQRKQYNYITVHISSEFTSIKHKYFIFPFII